MKYAACTEKTQAAFPRQCGRVKTSLPRGVVADIWAWAMKYNAAEVDTHP